MFICANPLWSSCLYSFLPESVRWLLVNDKVEEAENLLKKIAAINKRDYPANVELQIPNTLSEDGSLIDLVKNWSVMKTILIYMAVW